MRAAPGRAGCVSRGRDGGAGTGFYVDNVAIYGVHGFNHDAGIAEIVTGPVNLGEPVVLNFGVMGYGVETATPRLHYAIYDSATRIVTTLRVEYDIEASASKIFDAGLERNFGNRLFIGV